MTPVKLTPAQALALAAWKHGGWKSNRFHEVQMRVADRLVTLDLLEAARPSTAGRQSYRITDLGRTMLDGGAS